MTTGNFSSDPYNFQPETYIFPEEFNDDFRIKLRQYLTDISIALNAKETSFYLEEETATGRNFIPLFGTDASQNQEYRPVYRTVVDFGALPNATSKSVAHGISTTQNYSIVHLYAAATDPGASTITEGIPIPYASSTAADNIELTMDATNVTITTGVDRTSFTRCFVTIEYIQEV